MSKIALTISYPPYMGCRPSKWSTTLHNGTLKTNSFGVFCIVSCTDEFIANSTIGSNSNQLEVGCWYNKYLNTYSNIWWVRSVYLSDWRWYADISKILVCRMSHNADQKFNVKHRSWSCKTAFRTPKICTMASKNNLVHYTALNYPSPTKQGVKWTYSMNFSIQVKTSLKLATTGRFIKNIYELYIKPSSWNKNRIQKPMRSSSEVLALLTHAITLDEPFYIGYHMWPTKMIIKSLECFKNTQEAWKVTEIKLSK